MGRRKEPKHTKPRPDELSGEIGRRVRQLRLERGWSLERLSTASGVSRSMLSQIERNRANPTLNVTLRIAHALGVSLGEMVEKPEQAALIDVIRSHDRQYHYRSDEWCTIRTLSPLHLEKDVEFYEVRLRPQGALRSAPHYRGTREFLTVQRGYVRVVSAGDAVELRRGDSASYRADVPHAIENLGRTEAVMFLVVIYA